MERFYNARVKTQTTARQKYSFSFSRVECLCCWFFSSCVWFVIWQRKSSEKSQVSDPFSRCSVMSAAYSFSSCVYVFIHRFSLTFFFLSRTVGPVHSIRRLVTVLHTKWRFRPTSDGNSPGVRSLRRQHSLSNFFFEPSASKNPKEMNDGIPIRRWCGAVVSVYLYSNQIRSFRTDFLSIVRNRRHLEKILSWFFSGITAFFPTPRTVFFFLFVHGFLSIYFSFRIRRVYQWICQQVILQ